MTISVHQNAKIDENTSCNGCAHYRSVASIEIGQQRIRLCDHCLYQLQDAIKYYRKSEAARS